MSKSAPSLETRIQVFASALKRRQIDASFYVAKETADILRNLIGTLKFTTLQELLNAVTETGKRLIQAQPLEFVIGNIVRRLLRICREEHRLLTKKTTPALSQFGQSLPSDQEAKQPIENTADLKKSIQSAIGEVIQLDLNSNMPDGGDYIHSNEIVLTFGYSTTVVAFLKSVARKTRFHVIVAESAPSMAGHRTAKELTESSGIDVTLIPDSNIFALMARVHIVIVGTHAVMANGGLVALTGMHMVAVAAKYHSVPFVVCTGLYKLCPLYPFSQDTFNELKSPAEVLQFDEALVSSSTDRIGVLNPAFDYVPPESVALYLTNSGAYSPSYIYRLLAEYYHSEEINTLT